MKKNSNASLRSLAEKMNCNVSTVSRALRNKNGVSRSTALKIQKAARENGLFLHPKTKILQLILSPPQRKFEFYSMELFNAIRAESHRRGYNLNMVSNGDFALLNYASHGTLVMDFSEKLASELEESRIYPVVGLNNRPFANQNIYSIRSNDCQGIELCVLKLAEYGHTKIGYIFSGPYEYYTNFNRVDAFKKV